MAENTERKKKWLNRLRAGQRKQAALEAMGTDAAERVVELARQERQRIKAEIIKAIESVPSQDQRSVLLLRYVKCLEWHKVAAELHYSERHVHRLHSEALKKLRLPRQSQKQKKIPPQ